ncbi:hypothetical protein GUITHDRAFT_120461 [Guillardia theta CCMP2712]|uniref:Uncharacterized protein n=1 Tax=Guillardia theta (strain CCMP2712) TaxID=905079 RepID=L1IBQ9_GUITC|nr:hypothetical protein GUITHDRAFT_120461 [Guillardia theta CCMP2712]EKX33344.1 hypothetical protein GUITHDRAFT_120461 [Guillardia theta CCMP2712]|eukprot:XP_005820324.1 hypothetical protein GUITHDRAFT_120461 [Guillardia theta CCMP2712]
MRGLLVLFACFKRPASMQFADGREMDGSFRRAFEVARSLTPLTCLSGGFQTRSAQTLLDAPESDLRNIGNVRECLTLRGGDESSKKEVEKVIEGLEKEIEGVEKEIEVVEKKIKSVEKEIKSVENDIQVVEKEIKCVGQQDPRRHAERKDKKQLRKDKEQLRKKEEQLRKKEEQLRKDKKQPATL